MPALAGARAIERGSGLRKIDSEAGLTTPYGFVMEEKVKELTTAVRVLVQAEFDNDYNRCFGHYAGDDGLISRDGVHRLLTDAGVGNRFTRFAWVDGIMKTIDTDHDDKVSYTEIQAIL